VAETDKISNLRLVEGIYKIDEFIDSEIAMEDPLLFSHWYSQNSVIIFIKINKILLNSEVKYN
jgi:hypothetical protein